MSDMDVCDCVLCDSKKEESRDPPTNHGPMHGPRKRQNGPCHVACAMSLQDLQRPARVSVVIYTYLIFEDQHPLIIELIYLRNANQKFFNMFPRYHPPALPR